MFYFCWEAARPFRHSYTHGTTMIGSEIRKSMKAAKLLVEDAGRCEPKARFVLPLPTPPANL